MHMCGEKAWVIARDLESDVCICVCLDNYVDGNTC